VHLVGIGPPGVVAYVAAKHGQVGLMRTAAKELADRRIRVNTLHPGPASTPFQDDIEMRATGRSQEEAARVFDGLIPLGRHATPDEVAHAVLYLARRRERDGDVAHALDRRRNERVAVPRAGAPSAYSGGGWLRGTISLWASRSAWTRRTRRSTARCGA
jgi:NAD(P)-dependent dehydrogenase (short-subunit alcohol dehydrogenase family)